MSTPIISTPTGKRAVYYHTEWSIYARNYFVKDLPIDQLVDIAFSFVNVLETGEVVIADRWATLDNPFVGNGVDPQNASWPAPPPEDLGLFGQFRKLLMKQGKKFNLSLAIGGWTYSKHFSDAFATPQGRATFVTSLSKILTDWPIFNGISIDWEYVSDNGENYGLAGNSVRKEDGQNFILVLQLLRDALPGYTIASCCNAAPEKSHWPIEAAIPLLDQLHIMTYDFHDGNWGGETTSAHHANLYPSSHGKWSADEGVQFYLSRGVPASKIYIGGALYSRGFSNTDGIGMPAQGGSLNMSWEQGVVDYKKLPVAGSVEMWDDEAKAPYALDAQRRNIDTYDNTQSIREKAEYVKAKGLGGILLWETSADFPYTDDRSIMKALHDHLTHG